MTDNGTKPLIDIMTVQSSRVEETVCHRLSQEEVERYGKPYQHDGTVEKPFPQAELICSHQLQSGNCKKDDDEICSESETVVDEEVGYMCSAQSTIVLHLGRRINQFASGVLNDTLVGCSCKEERSKHQKKVNGHD